MKIDAKAVLQTIVVALLIFISGKVWEGVEIAKENRTHREMMREDIREMRTDMKGLRSDIDTLWRDTSELAEGID